MDRYGITVPGLESRSVPVGVTVLTCGVTVALRSFRLPERGSRR
ncbi:hypothetical protein SVIOM74S_05793 [Streptomyces violarus]